MKLAVLLALLAAFAVAQDTATVEGVVVNKVTGAGIADVAVRFRASKSVHYETRTDETGAFRIAGVKPGDYDAGVEKTGYFPVDAEAFLVFPGDRPRYHVDTAGAPLRLRLELNPPAVLRGRVVGADGNPARASVDLGKGRTVNTDTEGTFTFDKLSPGPYTMLARPKDLDLPAIHEGTRTQVVPTYFPSVVDASLAERIVVRAGAELSGYEIRLQSVPVYRVRGVVMSPDGKPAAKAVVNLRSEIPGAGPDHPFLIPGGPRPTFSIGATELESLELVEPFVTRDDGVFEFPSVPAGEWTLHAEAQPVGDSPPNYGATRITLGHGDPDDLKIKLASPFRLSGTIVQGDGSAPPGDLVLGLSLYSETGLAGSGGKDGPGGGLRLEVVPGANQVLAVLLFGNYYVDSVLVGSIDITKQRMELTPDSPPVKVIVKTAGSIHGTLEDSAAAILVLFPQSVSGVGFYAQSSATKTFELAGIPPGGYYAIAVDQFDPRTMTGAARLRSLIPMSTSVTVEGGSAAPVTLKVHHLAD